MIFHEWSLIFFTVLAQTAVGGYLLIGARALVLTATRFQCSFYGH